MAIEFGATVASPYVRCLSAVHSLLLIAYFARAGRVSIKQDILRILNLEDTLIPICAFAIERPRGASSTLKF